VYPIRTPIAPESRRIRHLLFLLGKCIEQLRLELPLASAAILWSSGLLGKCWGTRESGRQCIMTRYGIARFVGSWVSPSGYRLRIKKVLRDQASVDFLDPRGVPIQRPYMGGAPTLKMIAHYDDYNDRFEVDLWEEGKGFILDLSHHYNYELDLEEREALEPALSRFERDHFLDGYYSLFGPLDHFVRTKVQNKTIKARTRNSK
jgi:hypothetical protein